MLFLLWTTLSKDNGMRLTSVCVALRMRNQLTTYYHAHSPLRFGNTYQLGSAFGQPLMTSNLYGPNGGLGKLIAHFVRYGTCPLRLCWGMWRERNTRIFRRHSRNPDHTSHPIPSDIMYWTGLASQNTSEMTFLRDSWFLLPPGPHLTQTHPLTMAETPRVTTFVRSDSPPFGCMGDC